MAGFDGGGGAAGGESFGMIDKAETFGESDVTVTAPSANVDTNAGEVVLQDLTKASLSSYAPDGVLTDETGTGLYFIPDVDWISTIDCTVQSEAVSGTLYLDNISTSTNGLYSAAAASGDSFSISQSLTKGDTYRLRVEDSGDSCDVAFEQTDPPLTLGPVTFDGYYRGYKTQAGAHGGFSDLSFSGSPTSASVAVEWPHPPDIFSWDTATFQRTLSGETVEVFVEESTDDGSTWSEVAGPLARGDGIPVSSDDWMRFRVDLSRASTANEPQIDALYRRYTV